MNTNQDDDSTCVKIQNSGAFGQFRAIAEMVFTSARRTGKTISVLHQLDQIGNLEGNHVFVNKHTDPKLISKLLELGAQVVFIDCQSSDANPNQDEEVLLQNLNASKFEKYREKFTDEIPQSDKFRIHVIDSFNEFETDDLIYAPEPMAIEPDVPKSRKAQWKTEQNRYGPSKGRNK